MKKQRYYQPEPIQYTLNGKEPPQDLTAEKELLNIILTTGKSALKKVSFLETDVFYSDKNKAIFKACKRLCDRGEGITVTAVVRELTVEEKQLLESPELYVCGLTEGVVSEFNLESIAYHLLDIFGKRETILSSLKTIEAIENSDDDTSIIINTNKERLNEIENSLYGSNSYKKHIVSRSLNFDRPEPILFRGEDEILHLKDIQMIEGQSGSRKTFLVSAMIAGLLGSKPENCLGFYSKKQFPKVLLIDTEQSLGNVQRVARRVHYMAGFQQDTDYSGFTVLSLREEPPEVRLKIAINAIEDIKPDVVFIDNSKDLTLDWMDSKESGVIVSILMKLSSKNNCAILNVMHQNYGTTKARGHFGSALYEKISLGISLKADDEITQVSFSKVRNMPPQKFAFQIQDDKAGTAIPVLATIQEPTTATNKLADKFKGMIDIDELISYTELVHRVMDKFKIKDRMAKRHISTALENKLIFQNDTGLYYQKNNISDVPF